MKTLKEIQQHLENIILESDATRLDAKQITSLSKAMGLVEYLMEKNNDKNK